MKSGHSKRFRYYTCPRCHGKFFIPPDAIEIIHFCPIMNNQKVVIPIDSLKPD